MMFDQMKTYKAIDQNGETYFVSAYTETEAVRKAEAAFGWGNVVRCEQA